MQAIILAGGFGTRLQSVVKDVPKPMADIAGLPFLAHILSYLKQYGIKDVVISVHYLQEKLIEYFGDSYLGMNISYATEEQPLGTGGAIINSLKKCDKLQPVLVLNGDTFLQIDYQKLFDFYFEQKSQLVMVLRKMDDCSRYGVVKIDQKNLVTSFEEKKLNSGRGLINGGIYIIDPKIFIDFNLAQNFSFEQDFLAKHLPKLAIKGFVTDEYFIDIGIPDDYKKAQNELPHLIKNKALFLDRDGVINIDYGHVFEKEKFHFVDGIFDLCKDAQSKGYLIIIVTNQAGIAKGFYSEEQFLELTKWMEIEFAKHGVKIAKTFYCPFHVDAVIEKYRQDSQDRKPNPGMLLKAIEEFNIDVKKSIMIGDKESDMMAARFANIAVKILFDIQSNAKSIADKMVGDFNEIL